MAEKFDLIVISPVNDLPGEVNYVSQLFENGLMGYHLRKPLWKPWQMDEFLSAIPAVYHRKIVVHSHFNLTRKYALKGIHLNEENRKKVAALLSEHSIISTSFHSFEAIEAESSSYEYVFLSPVFDSISKRGHKAAFDMKSLGDKILAWRSSNPMTAKVFGLGGVDTQNIEILKEHGFSGAAVIGAIWNEEKPVQAFAAMQRAVLI